LTSHSAGNTFCATETDLSLTFLCWLFWDPLFGLGLFHIREFVPQNLPPFRLLNGAVIGGLIYLPKKIFGPIGGF
jgi:hypothetical protein